MIKRYETPLIKEVWSEQRKFNIWQMIELTYVNELLKFKNSLNLTITKEDVDAINEKLYNDVCKEEIDLIEKYEKETRHDFVAFLYMLEDKVSHEGGRWLHYGLTSSDIIDTTNSIRCVTTLTHIANEVSKVIYTLTKMSKNQYSEIPILARTHGQAAEIQQVKDIVNRWLSYARRVYDNLILIRNKMKVGKLSGAVGNNKITCEALEGLVLSRLGLQPVKNSSQIISRDIYLDYFYALLKTCLFFEKVAYDIRLHSQSEIKEICEGFEENQKGSSAMPHKKNPIKSENLSGLARIAKGYMQIAIDNCETQFERDISHSSAERVIFEDMAHISHFGITRLNDVLLNLVVNKDNCEYNISKNKIKLTSQDVLSKMINQGFSRRHSHNTTQEKVEKNNA